MGLLEWLRAVDWSFLLGKLIAAVPYVVAIAALLQAWGAMSAARSAKQQATAATEQVEALREQIALEAEVAMVDFTPEFSASAIGRGELGTESQLGADQPRFLPLDDRTRLQPESWTRRRTVEVRCERAPGPLIVEFSALPSGVRSVMECSDPQNTGSVSRGQIFVPHSHKDSSVRLVIVSHMASNPAHSWRQEITCFPRP